MRIENDHEFRNMCFWIKEVCVFINIVQNDFYYYRLTYAVFWDRVSKGVI